MASNPERYHFLPMLFQNKYGIGALVSQGFLVRSGPVYPPNAYLAGTLTSRMHQPPPRSGQPNPYFPGLVSPGEMDARTQFYNQYPCLN